ncbi:MAG: NAD-dependent epimerase/dehydratase family protein [Candidatus Binatia bacterium]
MSKPDGDLRDRDVLVVGGAGYIGAMLVPDLVEVGAKVRILDGLIYDNGFTLQHLLEDERVSFQLGDVSEPGVFENAARGCSDVVMLASLVGDPICKKYPHLAVRINEEAPLRIMDSLDVLGIDRFVFLSTCSNYGLLPPDVLATEESKLNPQSLYARTKIRVEEELLKRGGEANYAGTILRLATAYGLSPRMRFDLTVSQFIWEMATNSGLVVYDADTWRPYCHIRDISRSVVAVLGADKSLVSNEVFNVGDTKEQFTKRMIVDQIQEHVPAATVEYRTGDTDPRNYRVAFEKIADKLQFQCKYSVGSYIPRLIDVIAGDIFPESIKSTRYGNYEVIPSYARIEQDLASR